MWILLVDQLQESPTSGTIGWVVATLIGLIATSFGGMLAWLLKVHLPAQAKHAEELLVQAAAEREKDRIARHEMGNKFQEAIEGMLRRHEADAEKDRDSFVARSIESNAAFRERTTDIKEGIANQTTLVREAIHAQTVTLERAIDSSFAQLSAAMTHICEASTLQPKRKFSMNPQETKEPPAKT